MKTIYPPHPILLPPGEKGLYTPSPLRGEDWGEGDLIKSSTPKLTTEALYRWPILNPAIKPLIVAKSMLFYYYELPKYTKLRTYGGEKSRF